MRRAGVHCMVIRNLPLLWMLLAPLAAFGQAEPPPAPAQAAPPAPAAANPSAQAVRSPAPRVADKATEQQVALPGGSLAFHALVGTQRISDDAGTAEADVVTTAFLLDGAAPGTRPVTFAINGGPGAGSAWLNLLALGPWRVALPQDGTLSPSTSPALVPNAETWLPFTDLVFIDPPGTGYSRLLSTNDAVRRRIWSTNGEIPVLAGVMRRWLEANNRLASPKLLVGESYGGFRGPRLARALVDRGVALRAMLLVSPLLDFNSRAFEWEPYGYLTRLPAMAAAQRGATSRDALADVEAYATKEYLQDFLHGMSDAAAVRRMSDRVAALTGLPPDLVQRRGGRIDWFTERREREPGRIASAYDLSVSGIDPLPTSQFIENPDAVTDALRPVLGSAISSLYADRLSWRPVGAPAPQYGLLSNEVLRAWNYGNGQQAVQSVSALRTALAFDPRLEVLVMHGLYDLVTPYFASKMILDQLPPAFASRARLLAVPGGHMFYTRDASRVRLRDEGEEMVRAATAP